jgi:hypothetical protein
MCHSETKSLENSPVQCKLTTQHIGVPTVTGVTVLICRENQRRIVRAKEIIRKRDKAQDALNKEMEELHALEEALAEKRNEIRRGERRLNRLCVKQPNFGTEIPIKTTHFSHLL